LSDTVEFRVTVRDSVIEPPRIELPTVWAGGRFVALVPTRLGRAYFLEARRNVDAEDWMPVASVEGDGTTRMLIDLEPIQETQFYRVRVE
jgi:hypothetical protein